MFLSYAYAACSSNLSSNSFHFFVRQVSIRLKIHAVECFPFIQWISLFSLRNKVKELRIFSIRKRFSSHLLCVSSKFQLKSATNQIRKTFFERENVGTVEEAPNHIVLPELEYKIELRWIYSNHTPSARDFTWKIFVIQVNGNGFLRIGFLCIIPRQLVLTTRCIRWILNANMHDTNGFATTRSTRIIYVFFILDK